MSARSVNTEVILQTRNVTNSVTLTGVGLLFFSRVFF